MNWRSRAFLAPSPCMRIGHGRRPSSRSDRFAHGRERREQREGPPPGCGHQRLDLGVLSGAEPVAAGVGQVDRTVEERVGLVVERAPDVEVDRVSGGRPELTRSRWPAGSRRSGHRRPPSPTTARRAGRRPRSVSTGGRDSTLGPSTHITSPSVGHRTASMSSINPVATCRARIALALVSAGARVGDGTQCRRAGRSAAPRTSSSARPRSSSGPSEQAFTDQRLEGDMQRRPRLPRPVGSGRSRRGRRPRCETPSAPAPGEMWRPAASATMSSSW